MTRTEAIMEFRRISAMPHGQARIIAAEKLVDTVVESGFDDMLAASLLDLVEAYTFANEGIHAIATFARLLHTYDERPEIFDEIDRRNLYWEYKWVINDALEFPTISATQIEALIADMERRYRLEGLGLAPIRVAEFSWAAHRGMLDTGERLTAWLTEPASEGDDCRACQISHQVAYLLNACKYEEAIKLALTQRWECNQEPWGTRTALMMAALYSGDEELAVRAYKEALSAKSREPHANVGDARQIEFLAATGHVDQAVRMADEWERTARSSLPGSTFTHLLHLIRGLSVAKEERYDDLRARYIDEAQEIAQQFDARNGTSYFTQKLEDAISWPFQVRYIDLDAQAKVVLEASAAGEELPEISAPLFTDPPEPGVGAQDRRVSDTTEPGRGAKASEKALESTSSNLENEDRDLPVSEKDVAEDPQGQAAWARAEEELAAGEYLRAAYFFRRASAKAEESGYLEKAGRALAEAAQCLHAAGEGIASEVFSTAVPLMRAGDAPVAIIANVLAAWAPLAYEYGHIDDILVHLRELSDSEHAKFVETGGLVEKDNQEDSQERIGGDTTTVKLHVSLARTVASLKDSLARCLLACNLNLEEAHGAACDAAFAYHAGATSASDEAHSLWLAGRIAVAMGDTLRATEDLESAFENFTVARKLEERSRCGEELLTLYRSTGQESKAEELLGVL